MKESEDDCHQIDRERVDISWVTDRVLLEEYRKPRAEFPSSSSRDEVSVVGGH